MEQFSAKEFLSVNHIRRFSFLAASLFSLCVQAGNEASFDAGTNTLHIPKVLVGNSAFEADLFHDGNLSFSVTSVTPVPDQTPLAGDWETSVGVLSFRENGSYYHHGIEDGDGCFVGLETGEYEYDAVSRRIEVIVTRDDNGDCGLACNGTPCVDSLEVWVENDTLFVIEEGELIDFPRIP